MIDFTVEPDSADRLAEAFAERRAAIIAGVLEGMGAAMTELAIATASAAPHRTGRLAAAIMASVKVRETSKEIKGTISGDVGKLHVGLWQEEGVSVPATMAKRVKAMVLIGQDGSPVFFKSHRAFRVPGRPFMNPTLEEQKPQIIETLRASVREATAGL